MSNVTKVSGYTRIDKEECEFTWTIENIKFKQLKKGEKFESPIFSAKCNKNFYFRLICGEVPDFLAAKTLYLCTKNIVNDIFCEYTVSVEVDEKHYLLAYLQSTILPANVDRNIPLESDSSKTQLFSSGNITTIKCNLTLSTGNPTTFLDSKLIVDGNKEPIPKLKFDWVFLDIKFSDVKLRTKCGKEIPAHRLVLATASPVFRAMFTHDMMENQNQLVNMTDVSHEAAVEMLRYIYTGVVENNEISLTIDLLAAAEKYELEELKNKCEQLLGSNLSIENAFEMLTISDTHSANRLKKETVDFIRFHMSGSFDINEISNMILGKTLTVSK